MEQIKERDFIGYHDAARKEMDLILRDFNDKITNFWLTHSLYPRIEQTYSPIDYNNKPTTDHIALKQLQILVNPTKLLVDTESEEIKE